MRENDGTPIVLSPLGKNRDSKRLHVACMLEMNAICCKDFICLLPGLATILTVAYEVRSAGTDCGKDHHLPAPSSFEGSKMEQGHEL